MNGQGQSCSKIMFRTHVLEHDRTYVPKNHVLEHKLEHITVQKFAEKRPKTKKIEYAYDKIDRTAVAGVWKVCSLCRKIGQAALHNT